jgi:putative DNA primase/helicase
MVDEPGRNGNNVALARALLAAFRGREDSVACALPREGFEPVALDMPLSPEWFAQRHLSGQQCLGFYLLTAESRVWCACVDFDNKPEHPDPEWRAKAEKLYFWLQRACIYALVEISQSGTAAHAWIFFEQATDAWIPRAFFRNAGKKLGIPIREIYPKQDQLTKDKPLGNLIRFPLWNLSRFVDPENDWAPLEPLEALSGIERTCGPELKRLAHDLALGEMQPEPANTPLLVHGSGCNGEELPPRVKAKVERQGTLLYRRWHNDRGGMNDQTTSALVVAIACELVRQTVPTPEIAAALRHWCLTNDYEKGGTDRAISRAINAAYGYVDARGQQEPPEDGSEAGSPPGGDPPPGEQASNGTEAAPPEIHLTDLGNARRVVQRHGKDMRYCHPHKLWYVWDRARWKLDDTASAIRRAKETQCSLFRSVAKQIHELADAPEDENKKARLASLTAVLNHCLKWEHVNRLGASLKLAESEPNIPIVPSELDKDPFLLNVGNGTLDLRTGKLRPHRREDYITKLAAVNYDPDAKCPIWLACLKKWMAGKEELISYLQRAVGYALTGDVSEQCLFFLYGSGQNGKSTFLGLLIDLLGDYAIQTVGELLMERRFECHPCERADLAGCRLAATIETDEGKRMAEALMKQMTGGDKIRARQMRQDFFEFFPTHKFFLAANHKPSIQGTDLGTWRRIKLVPFTVIIPEADRNKHILKDLKAEKPGILNWALEGCLEWQKTGLGEPEEVKAATKAYREEQDLLGGFIAECCTLHAQLREKSSLLLDAYQKWSGDKAMTSKGFKTRMEEKGYTRHRDMTGMHYLGLRLISRPDPNDCPPDSDDSS